MSSRSCLVHPRDKINSCDQVIRKNMLNLFGFRWVISFVVENHSQMAVKWIWSCACHFQKITRITRVATNRINDYSNQLTQMHGRFYIFTFSNCTHYCDLCFSEECHQKQVCLDFETAAWFQHNQQNNEKHGDEGWQIILYEQLLHQIYSRRVFLQTK